MLRWMAILVLVTAVVVLWMTTMRDAEGPAVGLGRVSAEQLVLNVVLTYFGLAACYLLLAPQRWRRRLKWVAACTLAVLLALALVELPAALGLVDYGTLLFGRSLGGDGPNPMRLDAELLFRHQAYDQFVVEHPWDPTVLGEVPRGQGYPVEYRYDRNGFRNSQDLQEAPVVLVGDSFVEGYLVPQDRICAAQLGRILEVDVCNLGQNDYGPAQEVVVLQRYGVRLRPRVVVWFYYEGNDLFDLEDYEALLGGWRKYLIRPESFASRSFCLNAMHRLGDWMDRLRWRGSDAGRKYPVRLRPEIPGEDRTMHLCRGAPAMSAERLARLTAGTQEILRQAEASCRHGDAELLLVYVPTALRVYRDLCVVGEDSPLGQTRPDDFPDRLGRWAEAAGIRYLDLTAALRAAARQGVLVHFPADEHWSRHGQAVAAEEIAQWIDDSGRLDPE